MDKKSPEIKNSIFLIYKLNLDFNILQVQRCTLNFPKSNSLQKSEKKIVKITHNAHVHAKLQWYFLPSRKDGKKKLALKKYQILCN